MKEILNTAETKMGKSLDNLKEELGSIRTGRASPALFDKITVPYYGTPTPLGQVATISVPEARLVVIQPWERSMVGEIEKAIQKSELSLNPSSDGKVLRISIPPLTEERRVELFKLAKGKAEHCRVAVRNIRREANEELKKLSKAGEISEDDEKSGNDSVQKYTDRYVGDINKLLEAKETEIMEI